MKQIIKTSCILCENDQGILIADRLRYGIKNNVVRCTQCALVYLDPPFCSDDNSNYYQNEYRQNYQAPPPEEYHLSQIDISTERLSKIEHLLPLEANILEVGCAAGSLLSVLQDSGYKNIAGVEIDQTYSQYALDKLGHTVYQKPLEQLNLPPESVDAIISFHVLEHFSDPLAFLKTAAGLLKPAGSFIAEVPNIDDYLISMFNLKEYKDFYFQPAHNYYFSARTVRKLLEKAGFKSVKIMTYQRYWLMNGVNWLLKKRPTGLKGGATPGVVSDFANWLFMCFLRMMACGDTIIVSAKK